MTTPEVREDTAPAEAGPLGNRPLLTAIAMLIGVFSGGITTLVGGIMAYIFRGDTPRESWEHSHYSYHIRTFWGSVVGGIVGLVLTLILIGFLILAVVALWIIVRSVIALLRSNEHKPMPDPDTWLF